MPRQADPSIYATAERFVDAALRRDDSVFTPRRAIWSLPYLDELDRRYVQQPDLGAGGFEEKLRAQLAGASPEAHQLMAEILYVYYLPASNMSGGAKRQKLEEVLSFSPSPVALPSDLAAVLEHGIGSGGAGFHAYKWASVTFFISFGRRWKQSSQTVRDEALADPWRFRDFVSQIPTDGGGIYGREALLHLVHPDTFERVFSGGDKNRIATELSVLIDDPNAKIDRRIAQIRARLARRFGTEFDFYGTDGVRALWKRFDDPWAEFVYWGSRFHELPEFGPEERDYKLEIVKRLSDARSELLAGGDWLPRLKKAFSSPNNLTPWQVHDAFLKWCAEDLPRGAALLRRVWDGDADPLIRLGDFFGHFPHAVVSGLGSRTTLGSFLMLALDPYLYPPYRVAPMHAAYRLTGFNPGDEKDEVAMYRAGLKFFDRLRDVACDRGVELQDRLDAQSVTWCITSWPVPAEWPGEDRAAFDKYRLGRGIEAEVEEVEEVDVDEGSDSVVPQVDPLVALAGELLIGESGLREIADLVRGKGQAIFYGPPGTGKTYIARKLANALAGDPGRVRLVQFHPSYAYEDFVEGYRPRIIDGQAGFDLVSGPLKTLAARAIEDPANEYFLIVDELNRSNVAKVFGELYFLLEYRDEEIQLQYSDRPFRLPPNLRMIGTMNTADRSIALLDAALRRRFAFVAFFPDRQPFVGLLRRWLLRHRSDMEWVAGVVDVANKKLADRNGAIGPSFFMRKDLDAARLERVWRHEIVPYLEDYFFDAPERVSEFDLARLRKEATGETTDVIPDADVAEDGTIDGQVEVSDAGATAAS